MMPFFGRSLIAFYSHLAFLAAAFYGDKLGK
jgi:hypothetical protein